VGNDGKWKSLISRPVERFFLRDRRIPVSGNKAELVSDIFYTDSLENEIGAVPFQSVEFSPPPSFNELPTSAWISEGFPVITEAAVSTYLKA